MLLYTYIEYICIGHCSVIVIVMCVYACMPTRVNSQRQRTDDPKKRDYHPSAIVLASIYIAAILTAWVIFSILAHGCCFMACFVILFTILLVVLRKPVLT